MNINELIQQRRKELKLSVKSLSEGLGISRSTYYRYEKNSEKIPFSIIEPLAKLLELPTEMLLSFQRLENELDNVEKQLSTIELNTEVEAYVEELAQSLGYTLIKDYSTENGKNISAIVVNDMLKKISEEEYSEIISSVKDFTSFKLNLVYRKGF